MSGGGANKDKPALNIKLLTIGDSAVGKTCLISKFARDVFNPNFITTIGIDYKIKEVTLQDRKYKLLIWDTAGQERFRTITTSYFRGCQGILLVYDITNKKSYNNVRGWVDQIKGVTEDKQVPKNQPKETVCQILVGNKCDIENKRQVSFQQGKELADEFGIPFIETSAKDDINVKDAFMMITKNIVDLLGPDLGAGERHGVDMSSGGKKKGAAGDKKGCC
eukprot:g4199.t1